MTRATRAGDVNNLAAYVSFGLAYVLGHGTTAIAKSDHPVIDLPGWLPVALLVAGLAAGIACAIFASVRAQRGLGKEEALAGRLIGMAWIGGFAALFLAIGGLTVTLNLPDLPALLAPAGAGLIVGLLYLGEGALRRNVLHYVLGIWLALISAAGLFLGTPGLFWLLAVAGGGGYAVAAFLERRRLAVGQHRW